jgi:hypothetical protein
MYCASSTHTHTNLAILDNDDSLSWGSMVYGSKLSLAAAFKYGEIGG